MSESRSYDLLCKPWIPVVWRIDAAEPKEPKIGIREALHLQPKPVSDGVKKPSPKPVVTMFAAIPSGTNVAHWHHYSEDEGSLSEEIAAQFLTTVSPFNFKVKPGEARTLAGDPPMYALVLGKNLFETMVLNLPRPSGRTTAKQEKDNGPAWRTLIDQAKPPKVPTIVQGAAKTYSGQFLSSRGAMV